MNIHNIIIEYSFFKSEYSNAQKANSNIFNFFSCIRMNVFRGKFKEYTIESYYRQIVSQLHQTLMLSTCCPEKNTLIFT